MLNSCPNESSEEWKKVLAQANGNRERALELWDELGYADNENLNEEPKDERPGEKDPIDEEKDNPFSKLVGKIKVYVNKRLKILGQKKEVNQEKKKADIARLLQNIDAAEGAESIFIFVKDAYEKAIVAEETFDDIIENKDKIDKKILMQRLTAAADFANGYSILDEINKRDVKAYFSIKVDPNKPADELTPQEMLSQAINIRDKIKKEYVEEGIPLMARFLLGYKSEIDSNVLEQINKIKKSIRDIQASITPANEQKQRKRLEEKQQELDKWQGFTLDEKQLIEALKLASKDESALDFLIQPLISSEDSVLALFAKSLKSNLETARLKDIQSKKEVGEWYNNYLKSTAASQDNPAKFNEGIYERVKYSYTNRKGEEKNFDYMSFVQKYDLTKYYQARADFFKSLGKKPTEEKALKEYNKKVNEWFSENKEPLPEAERNKIIKAKEKEKQDRIITEKELEEWKKSVMYTRRDGSILYKNELSQPSSKYRSAKWDALYDMNDKPKNAKGEYHKNLLNMYLKAQDKLPEANKLGFKLPSIPKTDLERLQTKGFVDTAKTNITEAFQVVATDTQYGLAGLSEEGAKILPVLYTQDINAEDVSLDLARSVLLFNAMSNRYEALNELNAEISLFQAIIKDRDVSKTNSKGQQIVDALAKKLGYNEYIKQNAESYSKKHVDAFIDMIVYGEMEKAEDFFGLSGSKITNTLTGFSAITTIAVDLLKGIANNLQGNIQLIIEANSGQFFNKTNLAVGKANYAKAIPQMLADFGKFSPESLVGQLTELYDAIQGEFKDVYGKNVTGSVANRLFRTNTLFFNQKIGEHEIQVSTMLAMMDAVKVIDSNTGSEITLFKAYEKYGVDGVFDNTDFTESKRQAFQNRLHALNKRMHGVYNEFDKGTAQRYSLGRLAVMYRKHLVPGYTRRFKKASMDEELGTVTEGYYRTFWNTFLKDLFDFKSSVIKNWSTYSTFEKAQIQRTIAELTIILTATALVAILKNMADDDDDELKKNYAYNFVLYELIRMRSETAAYISPPDAYRIVKSPSAMTGTLERAIKFTDQFFLTWDPEKLEYQRKQGIWNEGDNKSWAYFLKLMGYSGYNITPEAAVESFEGTLNK